MAYMLVIDDEPSLRRLVRSMLESEGYEVDEAEDGIQGLKHIRKNGYDLVVTDVFMPEEDGIVVAQEIMKSHANTKVLAISGGGSNLSADWSLNMIKNFGVEEVLHKPFGKGELMSAVRRLLDE